MPNRAHDCLAQAERDLEQARASERDGFPEGSPFEHFGALQSGEAIAYAGEILDFVRAQMA